MLEAGLDEVLRGADEDAGAAADGGAEGAEVAAGFGSEKEDDLLGLIGDGDGDALFANLLVPGLDLEEPVVWRRIRGTAQEGRDEKIVNGLCGWQVGAHPDLVSGLEIGNLGDGQSFARAGDMDVHLGSGEVEAGRVCVEQRAKQEDGSESSSDARTKKHFCHHSILDGVEALRGAKRMLLNPLLLLATDAG